MSKERIKISEDLYDIMPSDYQDLVKSATYGKEDRAGKISATVQGTHRAALALRRLPGVHGLPLYPGLTAKSGRHRHGRFHRLHQPGVPHGGRAQHPLAVRQPKRDRLRV